MGFKEIWSVPLKLFVPKSRLCAHRPCSHTQSHDPTRKLSITRSQPCPKSHVSSFVHKAKTPWPKETSAPGPGFLSPERGSALSVPLIDSDSGVYLARLSCPHGRISIIGRDPLPSPPLQPRGPPLGESKALRKLQQLRECSHCEVPIQNTKYTNTKHQGLGDSYVTSYMLNNPLSGQ